MGSVLALAVGLGEWQATAPVVPVREQAGALAQIAELASLVPRDAILLFPRSTAGLRLSLPLHYVGERGAFVLPAEGPVDGVMEVVRRWREGGRSVYWIVPVGTRFPMPAGFRFVPAGLFTWDAPQLERPQDRLPRAIEANLFELQLYRVEVDGGG